MNGPTARKKVKATYLDQYVSQSMNCAPPVLCSNYTNLECDLIWEMVFVDTSTQGWDYPFRMNTEGRRRKNTASIEVETEVTQI